jgi:hypothetical protein
VHVVVVMTPAQFAPIVAGTPVAVLTRWIT